MPPTPASRLTQSTVSSMGSIPDFPIPVALPQPRRSVNLGPPPSARRGASSFYSNASFVSPIPEESPRSRSHTSFASSAAMPESWGEASPGPSPHFPVAFYDSGVVDEFRTSSAYDDESTDESRLVRSASIGKRGKPSLVMTKATNATAGPSGSSSTEARPKEQSKEEEVKPPRPAASPLQANPFSDGTGYLDASSSSSTLPTVKAPAPATLTPDAMLGAFAAASSLDPSDPKSRLTPSPRPYSRLSAIRRPPKLDMDAVNGNQARSSMTSLPDLIRRATRLAAMMDKGRRPASRFDNFDDYPDEKAYGRDGERELSSKSC